MATWDAVIGAEPALAVVLSGERIDAALLAIASFVDLKSPYALGHARAVAELAAAAAGRARPARAPRSRTLRRAALVHGLGRLGISNSIWDKPGPLGPGEWERVRLQPYLTERMLQPVGGAGAARRDRGAAPRAARRLRLPARAVRRRDLARRRGSSPPPTPTRRCASRARTGRAHAPPAAAGELRAEVRAGRLDADAVEAVLGAAGHRVPRRREGPGGPDRRARSRCCGCSRAGCRTSEIGERLVISPKTVGNHVEHIYAKIGASTRATASLFALRHGLLPEEQVAG